MLFKLKIYFDKKRGFCFERKDIKNGRIQPDNTKGQNISGCLLIIGSLISIGIGVYRYFF